MTNLPINTNIAPAQAPGKPASADDAQGSSGFGDVLARQVADAAPAEKNTTSSATDKKSGADSADAAVQESKAATLLPDISSVLPTDMLAALLVQQNQQGTAQPAVNLQLVVANQAKASATGVPLATLVGNDSHAPNLVLAEKTGLPQAKLPTLAGQQQAALSAVPGGQPPAAASTAKDNTTFADTLNLLGKNEAMSSLGSKPLRNINLTEIAATAQQSGALATAQAATTASGMRDAGISAPLAVNTPLAQAGWDNEFSQKITWLATQRDQSAELHLNPPQLGPLDVVIKVSADQATALFTSPHAAVREAIEQALPRLREMLAENGIMLGNATVGDQASRKEQNDFTSSQQGSGTHSGSIGEVTSATATGARIATRHNGMVDTFA
jgi:flagellar hook-length control protein FliK